MAGALRSALDRPSRAEGGSLPPVPLLARLAAVVTLINVPIHVAWALGSTVLLPGGASVAALPQTRAANAVVSGVLLAGAAVLFLVGGPWGRPRPGSGPLAGGGRIVPAMVLSALGTAAAVCLSHAVYGLISKGLFLAGLDTVRFPDIGDGWTPAERHTAAVLDVAVFEPWFLLEGVLLALAGWQYLRSARGRRRWVVLLSLATLALLLFGVLLSLTGRRVAVG